MSFSSKMPLCVAAVLACSVAPSSAAIIATLGTLSGDGHTHYGSDVGPGPFQDFITFSTDPKSIDTELSIDVTNSFTSATTNQSITGLTLALYSGTLDATKNNGGGTLLASSPTVHFQADNFSSLTYSLGDSGNFYFEIFAPKGEGSKSSASYGGTVSYSVEPVPLPASLPLLSVALLGVAACGHVLNRRRASRCFPTCD